MARPASQDRSSRAGRSARDLERFEYYFNRELSLLEFQKRVLAQAQDERIPLLERLRFLTICSSNLDEFFEIRVAGLKQQIEFGLEQPSVDGRTPEEALEDISAMAHGIVEDQYACLNDEVLPALRKEGIRVLRRGEWNKRQAGWVERYFENEVLPVLTPVALDPAHPFPRVLNKSLNFFVEVDGEDAFGRNVRLAVVQVPRSLPRVIPLPRDLARSYRGFVLLSGVIHAHIGRVFPGLRVKGCYQFRVTRNSDIEVDEEEIDNLLKAMSGELTSRRFSHPVRLEVADNMPEEAADYLLENFGLDEDDLYRVNGPVNLHRLSTVVEEARRRDLRFRPFVPGLPRALEGEEDVFKVLRRQDVLLHHPYQSFKPVIALLEQAADDPDVLAVKQTLYRTGADSPVVRALARAARAGKEVTVVIELRARFDEAENIELANLLTQAGANVLYGVVGYKTHAKQLLIVRREGRRLRRYVHVGTGNYHHKTTRAYTDLGLMSCDKELTEDVHHVFLQLTGLGQPPELNRMLTAPKLLYPTLLEWIERERRAAEAGERARILAKVNSLSDRGIITALYRASQAGVEVDLVVRGICRLRPGLPGVSENVRVRSIVGRFLEHHRVYGFYHGGDWRLWASSADWMERNLHARVETCFPLENGRIKKRVMEEVLKPALADNSDAWSLQSDGSYVRAEAEGEERTSAQRDVLQKLARMKRRPSRRRRR